MPLPEEIHHPEIAHIYIYPDPNSAASAAADVICDQVKIKPDSVISYATGNTQILVSAHVVERSRREKIDFSKTFAFHLDEYYPCAPSESFSFVRYLHEHYFNPLHLQPDHIFTLNGQTRNPQAEADRYEALIHKYGIDLSVLGVGPGGHIAFNEGSSPRDSHTRLIDLSPETIHRDHVERHQSSPVQALTQGIATILEAKQIILTAYGAVNGGYLRTAFYGPISSSCPVSFLLLVGPKVSIFLDSSAGNVLQ